MKEKKIPSTVNYQLPTGNWQLATGNWQLVLAIIFVCVLALFADRAEAAKEYRFMLPVMAGFKGGSLTQVIKNAGKAIEEKTGIDLSVGEFVYNQLEDPISGILDKMNRNEVDFAMMYSSDYLRYLMEHKSNAVPMFTLLMNGKPTRELCAYTRRADNITAPDQLRGKVWGGTTIRYVRYWLYDNGLDTDKPLTSFFSKTIFIPEVNAADLLDAVLAKKVDVITLPKYLVDMSMSAKPAFKKDIAIVKCVDYEHNWLFVYRKGGVADDDVQKLTNTFLNMHKDPAFAQFKFMLTAVKGKFALVDFNNLKTTKKIARLAIDKGWYKEEKAFIKQNFKK